jgi:hypothetical protein
VPPGVSGTDYASVKAGTVKIARQKAGGWGGKRSFIKASSSRQMRKVIASGGPFLM